MNSSERHYKLDESTAKDVDGVTYKRVRAVRTFHNPATGRDVPKGTLGGWVRSEKNLVQGSNAWVAEDATVRDDAVVSEGAYVRGHASVRGEALICGAANVLESATVHGRAVVKDNAVVMGGASVGENAVIADNSLVAGVASVYGNVRVCDCARILNETLLQDSCVVYGYAALRGKCVVEGVAKVGGYSRVTNSVVSGSARVVGTTCEPMVLDNACVKRGQLRQPTQVMTISPLGSRDATLTIYRAGGHVYCSTGCFHGTVDSFKKAVEKTHGDNEHAKNYLAAINFALLTRFKQQLQ